MKITFLLLVAALFSFKANAENSSLDAALGGGLGGAIGAVIGNEVAGKEGAVIGGALGAGTGAAVTTDAEIPHKSISIKSSNSQNFCPPGQAKKGNC